MNLKHILYPIAGLILIVAFATCNSDNDYKIENEQSAEGRIINFSIDARPFTKMDSITYPALKTRKFTVQNRGSYQIFNNDSLPVGTEIKSLKLTVQYASKTHARTDLVYPKDSVDWPTEWNEEDSVKFFQEKGSSIFYPQLKVVAYNGFERVYNIKFNIHKLDPDTIDWQKVKSEGIEFSLFRKGDTKVVASADEESFLAFVNDKTGVYKNTSSIESPKWTNEVKTNLPTTAVVNSLYTTNDYHVMISTDGDVYKSPIEDAEVWTKHQNFKIRSIVGLLPEVASNRATPLNEVLITIEQNGNLVYAKTTDFERVEDLKITTRGDSKVLAGFPLNDYSALHRTVNENENFLVTIAGKDSDNAVVRKPWIIRNIALANKEKGTLAEVSIAAGGVSYTVPFPSGITAFIYEDKIQAISSDSLSLYSSVLGDSWARGALKQRLKKSKDGKEGMEDMNRPSVVVDKEQYMWVFGGVSSKTGAYSNKIWRGRLNRVIFEYK